MDALKRLLWVDFALSLTAAWYFARPDASAATYALCTEPTPSAACQLALLNMQLFYGKSLAHSACILAASMSREPRTVALISAGILAWCVTMATLLLTSPFADRVHIPAGAVSVFAVLYTILLARWWWRSRVDRHAA
jgi:hypothetical protein